MKVRLANLLHLRPMVPRQRKTLFQVKRTAQIPLLALLILVVNTTNYLVISVQNLIFVSYVCKTETQSVATEDGIVKIETQSVDTSDDIHKDPHPVDHTKKKQTKYYKKVHNGYVCSSCLNIFIYFVLYTTRRMKRFRFSTCSVTTMTTTAACGVNNLTKKKCFHKYVCEQKMFS